MLLLAIESETPDCRTSPTHFHLHLHLESVEHEDRYKNNLRDLLSCLAGLTCLTKTPGVLKLAL